MNRRCRPAQNQRETYLKKILHSLSPIEFGNILWTDEASFSVPGHRNVFLYVWCGFTSKFFFGPYFLKNTQGCEYLNLWKYNVLPELDEVNAVGKLIVMIDGAPSHTQLDVMHFLESELCSYDRGFRLIAPANFKKAIIPWPSKSADLNPCDFWLWKKIRGDIKKNPPSPGIYHLKRRIQQLCSEVTPALLEHICIEKLHNEYEVKLYY